MPLRLGGRRCGISVAAECMKSGSGPMLRAASLVGSLCAVSCSACGGPLVSDVAGICRCALSWALSSVPRGNVMSDDVEAMGCLCCCSPCGLNLLLSSAFFLVGGILNLEESVRNTYYE